MSPIVDSQIEFDRTEARDKLAASAIDALKREAGVVDAALVGSLVGGGGDPYSDIDIVVRLGGLSDRSFAESLGPTVENIGAVLLPGWGLSPLPDVYVRSYYFVEQPVFWHVDIGLISDNHIDGEDIKNRYHWDVIFRMWTNCVKGHIRGQDVVDPFREHVARRSDVSHVVGSQAEQLRTLLDVLTERTQQRGVSRETMDPFVERCCALRNRFLVV